jgi:hypothetical protein
MKSFFSVQPSVGQNQIRQSIQTINPSIDPYVNIVGQNMNGGHLNLNPYPNQNL